MAAAILYRLTKQIAITARDRANESGIKNASHRMSVSCAYSKGGKHHIKTRLGELVVDSRKGEKTNS
jgi:hypothetical protein